jgi:hypothetical protein
MSSRQMPWMLAFFQGRYSLIIPRLLCVLLGLNYFSPFIRVPDIFLFNVRSKCRRSPLFCCVSLPLFDFCEMRTNSDSHIYPPFSTLSLHSSEGFIFIFMQIYTPPSSFVFMWICPCTRKTKVYGGIMLSSF